jgi:hypothetical protein
MLQPKGTSVPMTPEQAAAAAMREKAAQIFEEETETYNEGLSAVDVRLSYTRALKWPSGHKIAAAIRAIPLPEAKADPQCTCHPDDNPPRPCPQKYAYSECVAAASDPRGLGQREANPTGSVSAACSQTQDYASTAEGFGRVCSVDPRDEALAQASGALNAGILALDPVNSSQLMRAERQMRTALAAIETAQKGGV